MRVESDPRPSSAPWYMIYLSVTALGIGVVVAIRHEFPHVPERLELAVLGVLVGMFTVTSLLHWYDVTRSSPTTALPERPW
jgi:hypothetical protein